RISEYQFLLSGIYSDLVWVSYEIFTSCAIYVNPKCKSFMPYKKLLALLFFTIPIPLISQETDLPIDQRIQEGFKPVADFVYWLVFYPLSIGEFQMPIVVVIL